jgi:hypothetical protein
MTGTVKMDEIKAMKKSPELAIDWEKALEPVEE